MKKQIRNKITLTPELLSTIKRATVTITLEEIQDTQGWTIEKSGRAFNFMDKLGWEISCPGDFSILWTGEASPESIQIDFYNQELNIEHFKNGVVGFKLPWLFTTGCSNTGLSVRSMPNTFNPHIGTLDSIYLPQSDSYEIIIYLKILNVNQLLDIAPNYSLGLLQPYNLELRKDSSLKVEIPNGVI